MIYVIFGAIALVLAVGIMFVTGKGLGALFADQKPVTDEEIEEFVAHTNPVHMCRFIGICAIVGSAIASLFAVGLVVECDVLDIVSICLALAGLIAALVVYIVVFKYKPMKAKYIAHQEALAKEQEDAKKSKKATAEEKPAVKKESAQSKQIKAVRAVRK